MARARNIKPGFFSNEELVELPFSTRLLFIGLWTLADREGRLEDKPKRIKMNLFPADSVDVDAALSELEQSGFLTRYEVDGSRFIQVLAFRKHQNPHRDEKASLIPAFGEHGASTVQTPESNDANPADSLIPDSLNLNPEPLNLIPSQNIVERRSASTDRDVVNEVFAYWQKVMDSPRSQLDDKRRKAIKGALKLYEPRQVCEAILGCSRSAWHMGENDRRQKFNGLDLILRDAEHIDKFLEMASKRTTGPENIEQRNARIMAELMAQDGGSDLNVIDIDATEVADAC